MVDKMPNVQGNAVISTGNNPKSRDVIAQYQDGKTKDKIQFNTLQETIIKELATNHGDASTLSLEDLDLKKIEALKQKYNITEIHQNIEEEGVVRLVFGDNSNLRIDFQNKNERTHIKAQQYQEKYKDVGIIRCGNNGIYITRTNTKRSFLFNNPVAGARISDYTGDFDRFYDENSHLIPEEHRCVFKKHDNDLSDSECDFLGKYELIKNEEYFIPYEILQQIF